MTAVAASMEAKVASLESQLATVKAQADADQLNADHLLEQMEQRYTALAAEHSQVSQTRRDACVSGVCVCVRACVHVRGSRDAGGVDDI